MNISGNSPVRRTQGDFGEWRGDYTTQQQGDGHRVSGDFGEWRGDYLVSGQGADVPVLPASLDLGLPQQLTDPSSPLRAANPAHCMTIEQDEE